MLKLAIVESFTVSNSPTDLSDTLEVDDDSAESLEIEEVRLFSGKTNIQPSGERLTWGQLVSEVNRRVQCSSVQFSAV
jgi:hypothetical protein